jgi:hypothetical protein
MEKLALKIHKSTCPQAQMYIENDVQKEIVSGEGKRIPEPAQLDPKYIGAASLKNTEDIGKSVEKSKDTKPLGMQPKVEIEEKDLEPIKK